MDDVELTELEKLEVTRVDGVASPANGFPVLLLKALPAPEPEPELPAADDAEKPADEQPDAAKAVLAAIAKAVDAEGTIDEGPDVDLGHQIMALLAQAIINEAQEIKAGMYGESCDVDLLNCAASMISRWIGRETADDDGSGDMGMLMASAAVKAAEAVKTPDGASDSDTSKSTVAEVAEGEKPVDTEAQTGDLSQIVKAAITEATAPLEERLKTLGAELAKVKQLPVPGGPLMSVTRLGAAGDEKAAKDAAYLDRMADSVASPADADKYRQLAARARANIAPPA